MPQTILITGRAGFIGRAVARALVARGDRVRVLDSLIEQVHGSTARPEGLPDAVALRKGDIRDGHAVAEAVAGADAVFHLAAQVAVTMSLADPAADFAINLGGTLSLLEALRRRPDPPPLVFASTNKVYGALADLTFRRVGDAYAPEDSKILTHGIGEDRPLDFHTPYGCSKGGPTSTCSITPVVPRCRPACCG